MVRHGVTGAALCAVSLVWLDAHLKTIYGKPLDPCATTAPRRRWQTGDRRGDLSPIVLANFLALRDTSAFGPTLFVRRPQPECRICP